MKSIRMHIDARTSQNQRQIIAQKPKNHTEHEQSLSIYFLFVILFFTGNLLPSASSSLSSLSPPSSISSGWLSSSLAVTESKYKKSWINLKKFLFFFSYVFFSNRKIFFAMKCWILCLFTLLHYVEVHIVVLFFFFASFSIF